MDKNKTTLETYRQSSTRNQQPQKTGRLKWIIWTILTLGLVAGAVGLIPPQPKNSAASPLEFSSERAMRHLRAFALRPHPTGSAEAFAVRQYLVGALSDIGLTVEVQRAQGINPVRRSAGQIENVIGVLHGMSRRRPILLVAHYDSVIAGPGASDDGAGVASLLEAVRALKARGQMKRDIVVLLTDGEEASLLGSNAFISKHHLANNISLVLNFEARGTSGPSLLFETGAQNGWLIPRIAKAAPRIVTSSLFAEIYRRLPNDTDLTVFYKASKLGVNFAFIGGLRNYHTKLDNLEHLSPSSLQHHGSYALSLARYFADSDEDAVQAPSLIFFDLFGRWLLYYSPWWRFPLAFALTLLWLWAAICMRGATTPRTVMLSLLFLPAAIVSAAASTSLIWQALKLISGTGFTTISGDNYGSAFYEIGLLLVTLAAIVIVFSWFVQRVSKPALALGALFWWVILSWLTAYLIPEASYLFLWPALFSVIGWLAIVRRLPLSSPTAALLASCHLPLLVLFVPLTVLVANGLGVSAVWVLTVLVAMPLCLLTNVIYYPLTKASKDTAILMLETAIVAFALGGFYNRPSVEHPRPDSLFYYSNADTRKSFWMSIDSKPDQWTAEFLRDSEKLNLGEFFPNRQAPLTVSKAAPVELAAPTVELVDEQKNASGLSLVHVRIKSVRKASQIYLAIDPSTPIEGATLQGERLAEDFQKPLNGKATNWWELTYYAPRTEGLDLVLETRAVAPIRFKVFDRSYSLPDVQLLRRFPRPANTVAQQFSRSDDTFVARTIELKRIGT